MGSAYMNSVPTLYVDFDHTLFDTDRFLQAAARIAQKYGVQPKRFYQTFEMITDKSADRPYSFRSHTSVLFPAFHPMRRSLLRNLGFLLERSAVFLYRDSIRFLHTLRTRGWVTAITTFAEPGMRRRQIRACRLECLVNEVLIFSRARSEKIAFLKNVCARGTTLAVVDDHPAILSPLTSFHTLLIRIQRTRATEYLGREPDLAGVEVFADLDDASRLLARTQRL
jgi:hypothetical protein